MRKQCARERQNRMPQVGEQQIRNAADQCRGQQHKCRCRAPQHQDSCDDQQQHDRACPDRLRGQSGQQIRDAPRELSAARECLRNAGNQCAFVDLQKRQRALCRREYGDLRLRIAERKYITGRSCGQNRIFPAAENLPADDISENTGHDKQ